MTFEIPTLAASFVDKLSHFLLNWSTILALCIHSAIFKVYAVTVAVATQPLKIHVNCLCKLHLRTSRKAWKKVERDAATTK